MKQRRGRGGTGRRKGLKIPRWQHRVGSSPTARTSLRSRASKAAAPEPLGEGGLVSASYGRQATCPDGLRVAQPPQTVRAKRVRRSLSAAKAKTDFAPEPL